MILGGFRWDFGWVPMGFGVDFDSNGVSILIFFLWIFVFWIWIWMVGFFAIVFCFLDFRF